VRSARSIPTGADVVLPAGAIEWMRAGNGVWHTGEPQPGEGRLFSCGSALPPALENGPSESMYVQPSDVPDSEDWARAPGERNAATAARLDCEIAGVSTSHRALRAELASPELFRWMPAPSPGESNG
jgi:hypothetical protein